MGAFVIAERLEIRDPARFQGYLDAVTPTIEAHGGRYHVVTSDVEVLEGEWCPGSLVIFEFPSLELARAFWESDEYAPLKALRRETAAYNIVLAPGLDEAGPTPRGSDDRNLV